MIKPSLAVLLLALSAAPAAAQSVDPGRSVIVVEGRGVAERAPDDFYISGELRADAPDQLGALRAIESARARLADGLSDMDGLTGGRLLTQRFAVNPVSEDDCSEARRQDRTCAVGAYTARIGFTFKGRPVERAGDAASLASELGAVSVAVAGTEVEDEGPLRAEANRLAFLDARRQADVLAEASGQRISGVLRVQDRNARTPDELRGDVEAIVLSGSRIRPSVAVPLAYPPVSVEQRVIVTFAVD